MEDVVLLTWRFTPKDYFEDEIRIVRDDYEMVIKDGEVEARINPELHENDRKMREEFHRSLNVRFLGVQILTHKKFALSKPSMCRIHPDGRRVPTIFPETAITQVVVGNVDLVEKDKNGNVVGDSRRDRIERKKNFAELVELHSSDPIVVSLLSSYRAAVHDPEDELIHLYEIRDALSFHFIGEKKAREALGLSKSDWSRLGQLANSEPSNQGRHRVKVLVNYGMQQKVNSKRLEI